jgi:hypothetical protein
MFALMAFTPGLDPPVQAVFGWLYLQAIILLTSAGLTNGCRIARFLLYGVHYHLALQGISATFQIPSRYLTSMYTEWCKKMENHTRLNSSSFYTARPTSNQVHDAHGGKFRPV